MLVRRAEQKDIPKITELLNQVLDVHHRARPDIFKANCRKYTVSELEEILADDQKPVFVADDGEVLGYAFCKIEQHLNDNILTDIKTLYIDDLCVDKSARGKHIGKFLFEYVKEYAKSIDCYNLTLNVWNGNFDAIKFYEKCGLTPQKFGMETILK